MHKHEHVTEPRHADATADYTRLLRRQQVTQGAFVEVVRVQSFVAQN